MATDWPQVRVADVAAPMKSAMSTGPFGSAISSKHFVEQGMPVIRGSNLSDSVSTRLDDSGLAFVGEEKAKEFTRSVVRHGDLVFTCWGTIGQVGLIDCRARFPEYVISNKQMKLTPNPEIVDSLYLYYVFSSPTMRGRILGQAIGSSVPGFNLGQLRELTVPLPPLNQQRRISHILGTLDDKIELNRRMNQTLEEIASALFKSWFVDFDPVRAKAEGRDSGLPKQLADLFPDRLVDSELGEIPEGWNIEALDEMADFRNGLALQKYPHSSGPGLPVIKIAQLRKGGVEGADLASLDVPSDYVVENGDLLFSWSGSLMCEIWAGGRGALNQHLFKVESSKHSAQFMLLAIRHHLDRFRGIAADKATTMGHIKRSHLSEAKVALPTQLLLAELESALCSLLTRTHGGSLESETLVGIRDRVLPVLLGSDQHAGDPSDGPRRGGA